METLEGVIRSLVGVVTLGFLIVFGVVCLIPLLPWHTRRIRFTNWLGSQIGPAILGISGCEVTIEGQEHVSADFPTIYAGNHTSIFDAFFSIWLSPSGTVGVAKRGILYYPFYGLAWVMAGHLLLDRAKTESAKRGMRKMGQFVRDNRLHIFMYPEGTRAADGRLLPFKKGVAHLALQTGLPITPMIVIGAHKAWIKGSLVLRKVPIHVRFLPPVDTSDWTVDTMEQNLADLRERFIEALPEDQRPLEAEAPLAAA